MSALSTSIVIYSYDYSKNNNGFAKSIFIYDRLLSIYHSIASFVKKFLQYHLGFYLLFMEELIISQAVTDLSVLCQSHLNVKSS